MKKVAIGFAVGSVAGIASTVIGLRGYANDPLVPPEIRLAIPGVAHIIELSFQGSAVIWLSVFFLGLLLVAISWAVRRVIRK